MTVAGRRALGRALVAGWIGLAVAVPFILFFAGTIPLLPSGEGRAILHAVTIGASLLGLWLVHREPARAVTLVVPAGIAFVAANLAAAAGSARAAESREALLLLAIAAPAYLLIRSLAWESRLESRIRWLVVVCATLLVVPYLVEVALAWAAWFAVVGPAVPPLRPGNVSATLGSSNVVGAYAYLLGPYATWIAWQRSRRWALVLGILCLATLILSGSRGAWLGAACGAALAVAVGRPRAPIDRRIAFPIGVALAMLLVVFGPAFLGRVVTGDVGRFELWAAALGIAGSDPILGGGPGSWQTLRPLFPIDNPSTAVLSTAHNAPLHLLAEIGIVGLAAALLLVAAVGAITLREVAAATGPRRGEVAVAVGALAALGVHSLFDPMFHLAGVMVPGLYLLARLDPPRQVAMPPPTGRAIRVMAVASAVMVLAAALLLAPIDAATLIAQDGSRALHRSDWPQATERFGAALALDDRSTYRHGQALALSQEGTHDQAIPALLRTTESEPLTIVRASLAAEYEAAGQMAAALAEAGRVDCSSPYDLTAVLNVAAIQARAGDTGSATACLAPVFVRFPELATGPGPAQFADSGIWQAAVDRAIEVAGQTDPLGAAAIALAAGDRAALQAYLERSPASADKVILSQLASMGSSGGGAVQLEVARDRSVAGATPRGVAWYAQLARAAGSARDVQIARVVGALVFGLDPLRKPVIAQPGPIDGDVLRLPNYPEAMSFRQGFGDVYPQGFLTIVMVEPP